MFGGNAVSNATLAPRCSEFEIPDKAVRYCFGRNANAEAGSISPETSHVALFVHVFSSALSISEIQTSESYRERFLLTVLYMCTTHCVRFTLPYRVRRELKLYSIKSLSLARPRERLWRLSLRDMCTHLTLYIIVLRGSGDSLRYKAVKPRVKKRNKTEPKVHSQLSMAHAENSHCCPCPTQVAARTSVLAEELFQAPLPPTMQVMLLAGSLAIAIDPHVHVPQ